MPDEKNRPAGRSTRKLADKRYKARVRFVLPMVAVVILLLIVLYFATDSFSRAGLVGAFAFLALAMLIRLVMAYTDAGEAKWIKKERQAARGAKAEEDIGALLDNLGDDYLVKHDIESPYGNIDHVVISRRSGLFLVETKSHGGRVSVANGRLLLNGRESEKDFIAQALKNTYWLRDRIREATQLEIWITPIIVFTNAFVEQTGPIKNVRVVNKKYLLSVLQAPDQRRQTSALWENRRKIASLFERQGSAP